MAWNIIFQREDKRFVRIAVDRCFPRSQADTGNRQSSTARGMKAAGMSGCQGTPWSEELDGKELHGALGGEYDQEP